MSPGSQTTNSDLESSGLKGDEVRVVIKDYPKEVSQVSQSEADGKRYYEKAFSLFLLTLGVRLSEDQKEELKELIEEPGNYVDKNDQQRVPEDPNTKVERVANDLDFAPVSVFAELIKSKEIELDHIQDQGLIKKLQAKILKDPDLFYARSKYVQKLEPLKNIMGNYRGALFRIAGKKRGQIDDIKLSMDFRMKEDVVEGDFTLILSNDGRKYSSSRGNGSNGNVRLKEGQFVLDAGPGTFFHFTDESFRQANFYVKGELVGFAKFERL